MSHEQEMAPNQAPKVSTAPKPRGYWQNADNIRRGLEETVAAFGHFPLQRELKEIGLSSLSDAIAKTGGANHWREQLGQAVRRRPKGYWKKEENVERELRQLIAKLGHFPTRIDFVDTKAFSLAAILYTVGGVNHWREKLGFSVEQKPRGYWQNPENIEAEARKAIEAGSNLSPRNLKSVGLSSLASAINRFYPGRVAQLRANLGIENPRHPKWYWDSNTTERELRQIVQNLGHFPTGDELGKMRKSSLAAVMERTGGVNFWREKLDAEIVKKDKGYWAQEENIRSALERVIQENAFTEFPTQKQLIQLGESSLSAAMSKTGGFASWADRVGLPIKQRPEGYWQDVATIEEEAKRAIAAGLELKKEPLAANGFFGLYNAIYLYYPGRLPALLAKLGFEDLKKPKKFWQDPKNIEEEARKTMEVGIRIFSTALIKAGLFSLSAAITKYYPGSFSALREKLGIAKEEPRPTISPDQANEQLTKLLEGAK